MSDGRIPTHVRIDAVRKKLTETGMFFYIPRNGDLSTGLILLHLNGGRDQNKLFTEQRNLDGVLKWQTIHKSDLISDEECQTLISKQTSFDEDLWVIEIEDPEFQNPFELQ